MPRALASGERAMMHPSLFESTTTGLFFSLGLKALSQEAKKLLQSTRPNILKIRDLIVKFFWQIYTKV